MKKLTFFLFVVLASTAASAQVSTPDPAKPVDTLQASCGLCKFDMKAAECELAVIYKGEKYWVTGTQIDDHGNAHADDGFCNAVRKAEVQGSVVDGKFKVTYFKLLPEVSSKK